jgi:hypothetical protein
MLMSGANPVPEINEALDRETFALGGGSRTKVMSKVIRSKNLLTIC